MAFLKINNILTFLDQGMETHQIMQKKKILINIRLQTRTRFSQKIIRNFIIIEHSQQTKDKNHNSIQQAQEHLVIPINIYRQ